MNMQLCIPEATLNKSKEVITVNQIERDIPVDMHLYDIFTTYSAILKCGLKDLNGKFTWNEVQYMLASINSTLFPNDDINFTVSVFITGLADFEIYDEVQARQFGTEAKELVTKLQKEHPISVFALLTLLNQYLVIKKGIHCEFQEYIEQYLQLKA